MLGDNIKRLMIANGYTQKQLAMRSQCTESAISKYIHNERTPSISVAKNLAIALGTTVDELVRETCPDCRYFVGCECFDGKTCDMYEEVQK